jgi:hypothetical protein
LRIRYRAVVHGWSDFFQHEVEYERRFEIADFLIEVLGEVALDGFDRLLSDVVRQGNVNVTPQCSRILLYFRRDESPTPDTLFQRIL